MSSSYAFLGAGFSIAGANALSQTVVQVHYTSPPQAFSSVSSTDALNPSNYTLVGPVPATVSAVTAVGGDPLSFDLQFLAPLLPGMWTVIVANVRDPFNVALSPPTSATFTVTATGVQPPLTPPVQFDEPIIRKHLSPALAGPNWDGLIAALEQGDIYNRQNAAAAFNQLYISTASGPYLTQRAADYGIQRPVNVGMADDLFRQLVINVNTDKVVQEAIREILEVFYGQDSLRAFAPAGTDEPYNLSGNTFDLQWIVDESQVFNYTFQNTDFVSAGQASAIEVAAVLTRVMEATGSAGFAATAPSPSSLVNAKRVRIYSPSLGLRSAIRVTGGRAQNVLRFPEPINPYRGNISTGSGYNWVYTNPSQGITVATLTTTGTPLIDFSVLRAGDYVIINQAGAQTPFSGTFRILDVNYSYSGSNLVQTLTFPRLSPIGTYLQASNAGYTFYRPAKQGIYEPNGRTVIVSQSVPGRVDISIPATTAAVNRTYKDAAYLHANAAQPIIRYSRTAGGNLFLTFATPHGLAPGDQIYVDNVLPASAVPFVDFPIPGAGVTDPRQNAASLCTIVAELGPTVAGVIRMGLAGCLLSNGQFLTSGGQNAGTAIAASERLQENASVVIADGTEADGALAAMTQWVTTPDMNVARSNHAMCTLGSGAVVCGGNNGTTTTAFNTTETYIPGGSWTSQGAMATAREFHGLVDLKNGTALTFGGQPTSTTYTATTELFNGTSWAASGSMLFPRSNHVGLRLSSGKVLAAGGLTTGGFFTPTSETWNGGVWTASGNMNWGRQDAAAVLLPDDYVMVTGGLAAPASIPGSGAITNTAELWTPTTGRWSPLPPMINPRQGHLLVYDATRNRVWAVGGTMANLTPSVEYYDLATGRWSASIAQWQQVSDPCIGGALASGNIYVDSGDTTNGPELLVPASDAVSSGGINNLFLAVVAAPTAYTAEFSTTADTEEEVYTSNFSNFNPSGFALSLSRASGTVTATMTIPAGYTVNIQPGDLVYINALASSGLVSGIKTVLTSTATSFTYAEGGGAVGPVTQANVSLDLNTAAIATPWAEAPAVAPIMGPYIYDPVNGLPVTAGNSTTTLPISADLQYDYIEVATTNAFPVSGGYIALGFGFETQTPPIKLLDVYTDPVSGYTRLVIDYSYRFTSSFPVGSEVTLLTGKQPYEPRTPEAEQTGGFWLTDSPAGRVAAEAMTAASLAAGIKENIVVVYPGDIGLGGAGLPTRGAAKLSDIVEIFAGNDPEGALALARKQVTL